MSYVVSGYACVVGVLGFYGISLWWRARRGRD